MPVESGRKKLSTWPRLTPKQRELMVAFDKSRYGDLHLSGRGARSGWTLIHHGFIDQGSSGWHSITQRGRDYVRFGMSRRKKSAPRGDKEA